MTPSDLDQLADYAEGLLDGTPDAEVIATRIATDQEWADAYRQLTAVLPGLTADLGALPDVPMPDDVAAALDRTLAEQPRLEAPGPSDARDDGPSAVWAAPQPPDELDRRRAARRARTGRAGGWALAAGAAALVAVACVGVFQSLDLQSSDDTAASSAGDSEAKVMSGPSAPLSVHVSGTAYSSSKLGSQATALLGEQQDNSAPQPEASASPSEQSSRDAAQAKPGTVPPELRRLLGPTDLRNCLNALGVAQPLTVDYATLDGTPAVIVVSPDADPALLDVVAAGPDCGVGRSSDELARTSVPR